MGIPLSPHNSHPASRRRTIILAALVAALLVGGSMLYYWLEHSPGRMSRILRYLNDPQANAALGIQAGERCGDAPFVMPTDGIIGFIWGDSFGLGHSHQGLDIFGSRNLNEAPVVAAYDGYLRRGSDWRSAVIIRHTDDPLSSGRQIWTYYSHMADPEGNSFVAPDFPPGTNEVFVKAGTLLGYQGNYSGDPNSPTGIHLHFSIVLDDGYGTYLNELDIRNTLDPLPYLGIDARESGQILVCDRSD
jgi:hypothetical protein